MKRLSILLAVIGLLLAGLLLDLSGVPAVVERVAAIGWRGCLLLVVWQGVLFLLLGAAWNLLAACGTRMFGIGTFWLLVWARMVRDAASNCLPLAQMGGFVLGARAATLRGMRWELAAGSTIVDATAELLAQIGFAIIGLCILVARRPASSLAMPLAVGLFVAAMATTGFMVAQIGATGLFARLGRRIARHRFAGARAQAALLAAVLEAIYRRPARLALATSVHLLGWLGTGIAGWLTFRLAGADLAIEDAIAIEGLLHAILAASFLVPGNIGVQEAAYVALGAAFGVSAEMSVSVSLIRRGRDLAIGVPVLLAFQWLELRRPPHATADAAVTRP